MDIESSFKMPADLYLSKSDKSSYIKQIRKCVKKFLSKEGYEHSIHVANALSKSYLDDGLILWTIGILHDFIEDTKDFDIHTHYTAITELDSILIKYLTPDDFTLVRKSLDILTRQDDTYFEYIQKICDSKNIYSIYVKLRDIQHNMSRCYEAISKGTSDPFYQKSKSLLPRYEKAHEKILHAYIKWFTGIDI